MRIVDLLLESPIHLQPMTTLGYLSQPLIHPPTTVSQHTFQLSKVHAAVTKPWRGCNSCGKGIGHEKTLENLGLELGDLSKWLWSCICTPKQVHQLQRDHTHLGPADGFPIELGVYPSIRSMLLGPIPGASESAQFPTLRWENPTATDIIGYDRALKGNRKGLCCPPT